MLERSGLADLWATPLPAPGAAAIPILSGLLFSRGRVALYAILKAMGVGEGDDVAMQAFACLALPEAIIGTGARANYIDIDAMGYNMDPGDLERKITHRTKAVVVQHTYGIPADLERITAIAGERDIPVIEDCCHTLTSSYNGQRVGSFGAASFYSFGWGKPLVAGTGGSAVFNDPILREKAREQYAEYREPARASRFLLPVQFAAHALLYRPSLYWPLRSLYGFLETIGAVQKNFNPVRETGVAADFSWRMPKVMQGTLKKKLNNLDSLTRHSRWVAEEFRKGIVSPDFAHPCLPAGGKTIFARYPLRTPKKQAVVEAAQRAHVEVAPWYTSPVHPLMVSDWHRVHYQAGSCPNAEVLSGQVVTLPTHAHVGEKDVRRIIRFVNAVSV